jgi:hypothetical protein
MADRFITLLDIAARNGDQAVGLIEEVTTVAPEFAVMKGRTIPGISYKTKVRMALPASPIFRAANEGTDIVSSVYAQKLAECYYLDAQFRIDEAVADAPEEGGRDMLLADEATGVIQQKAIALGNQFYNGTTADAKGFTGLLANYDSTNMLVKAGGTTSSVQTSAWIVWNDLKGIHFIFGGNGVIAMNAWARQQVQDGSSKAYFAWVNNLSGWIGLSFNHTKSACRIANCENVTDKRLTDSQIALAVSKFPLIIRAQLAASGFIFMNPQAALQLQQSRSVTIFGQGGSKPDGSQQTLGPTPTESNGIPIVLTESITNTEAVVS